MKQYHDLVTKILDEGVDKSDRTGTGTLSIFGHQMRFDLRDGFPLLGSKKTNFYAIMVELLWFLRGGTNVDFLHKHNVHIWDEWADPKTGDLGPVYGAQWRSWPGSQANDPYSSTWDIDQIANIIRDLVEKPYSRRHIVTAWNPAEIDSMALPPCHTIFQFNVRPDQAGNPEYLDCQLYQRSGDVFLGVPFNIASYALLTHMIAHVVGLTPGDFIHTLGDAHLYKNHLEQAQELLGRGPDTTLPWIHLNSEVRHIDEFLPEDVELLGYNPKPAIKAEISV